MATVIVSAGRDANNWAQQFCRRLPWTRGAGMPSATGSRSLELISSVSRESIVRAVEHSARAAGASGEVIYSIGHGNDASVGASAQLGNGHEFDITQHILQADETGCYGDPSGPTGRVRLSAAEQEVNLAFRRMGRALTNAQVRRFTFLTCVLGNNPSFLRQIKAAWGGTIEVAGFTKFVATTEITMQGDSTYPRVSLYLSYDQQGLQIVRGTDVEPATFLEMPSSRFLVVV